MAKHPNDDLFSSSTMSFGEHLEELRSSLFRALVGLFVGFLVGLAIASSVVDFIKGPLEKALKSYYREGALEENVPPEMRTLIAEEGMVSETISVEPFGFLEQLGAEYPDQFGQLRFTPHQFVPDDIKRSDVPGLCDQLSRDGASREDSPGDVLFRHLSDDDKKRIETLATLKSVNDAQRAEVISMLNALLEQRSVHESEALSEKRFLSGLDDDIQCTVEQIREGLKKSFDPDGSRRLNRLLIAGVYRDRIRRPRVNLVEVTTWKPVKVRVQTLSAHEAFMIWIKAALISGAVISSPWVFLQIWSFVAAGLYPQEKRYVWVFLPFSLALFLAGAAMAFFFVFEPVLDFLFSFNRGMNIDPDPRISEWLGFVLFLPIGFGISFQLPLVMLFLERIGIFTVGTYLQKWRIAILVIFVLAMLLTPADPVSMLLMAMPLTLLYFGGVALCKWMPRTRSPFDLPDEV